jgi:hypothetical protein
MSVLQCSGCSVLSLGNLDLLFIIGMEFWEVTFFLSESSPLCIQ